MIPIPYGKQSINEEDIEAVIAVLKSDWITQGPAIERFERAVAEYCGVNYAIAVSSGTAALHLACLAAGLKEGDILWTSPNTFVASANCALYCGATPNFVDIDPLTYNLSVDELEAKLSTTEAERLPKILMPVHFAGQSCEMERINDLGKKYGLTIIEDACHALGGSYKGHKIGACIYSDMVVFSFHPVKSITTGEGGMIITNNEDLYQRLLRLRTHGITRNPSCIQDESHGPWYYEQVELGFNYRITDIQAALGFSQLQKLDSFIDRRRYLAERYNDLLKDLPLVCPYQHPDASSAYHIYPIRLKLNKVSKSRQQVFNELRESGINVNVHYIPVHTQPYYRELGFKQGTYPKAEQYYKEAISIPLFYTLTEEEQDFVVKAIKEIVR
ncbi:MAG TPA: UDP-4-amino-4,6-dideoxy-N-acetyl-beta-L-altrosamine transaminase [Candidatus Aquicultor sp.]|jgi:UDP-4-amino-4,6-dideoxy-N-acetyl-beta-L-altrosamine transaminase